MTEQATRYICAVIAMSKFSHTAWQEWFSAGGKREDCAVSDALGEDEVHAAQAEAYEVCLLLLRGETIPAVRMAAALRGVFLESRDPRSLALNAEAERLAQELEA